MYLLNKTNLRPLNGRLLVQRLDKTTLATTQHAIILPKLITEKFVVVAVANDCVPNITVGDVVRPYHSILENIRKDNNIDTIPSFASHYDDETGVSYEALHYMDIHCIEGISKQGESWDWAEKENKSIDLSIQTVK